MKRFVIALMVLVGWGPGLSSSIALAQQPLVIKPLAEKNAADLPAGPLFWRIEEFSTLAQARAVEGPWSLAVASAGRFWLFTLGPAAGSSTGGNRIADLGPIPRVAAPRYLLRINEASGPAGSTTAIHSHPGSEAFFVLAGEQSIRGPGGVMRVEAGRSNVGSGGDIPMQVSSSGASDLLALVMFVVDATRPFSSPAALPPVAR